MRIPIFISDRIYIPRIPKLNYLFDMLRDKFTYSNPEYYKKKSLNLYTGGMRERVSTWFHVSHRMLGECITFPRGGLQKILDVLEEDEQRYVLHDKRLSKSPITYLHNDIVLRADQKRLVEAIMETQTCLIRSPTASGKTETALKATEYMLKDAGPVLVIVWETDLMEEWRERASKRFGLRLEDIGVLGGNRRKIKEITVGMQQTLKNCAREYRNEFGAIICDEVQRFAASTYQEVIDVFPAKYRVGLSADETRKDAKEYLTYDLFGEVAEQIERAALIEKGKLHDVVFRLIETGCSYEQYSPTTGKMTPWIELSPNEKNFNDLLDYLGNNAERNELIWKFMEPVLESGHSVLVITHRVKHAKYWEEFLRSKGIKVGLMIGGVKNKEQFSTVKKSLRNGSLQVGVGTLQKIGQALDITKLDRSFVLTPVAANKQQLEQVAGRLRRIHDGKTDAICYYMFDELIYPYHAKLIAKQYKDVYVYDHDDYTKV